MRDPIVDQQRDVWIRDEVEGFLGGWIGGHDYGGRGRVGGGGEVGVVHEGDVWEVTGACCEMELSGEKKLDFRYGKFKGEARGREWEKRTNRAFWRHCATSSGRVLLTWRLVVPAEAS